MRRDPRPCHAARLRALRVLFCAAAISWTQSCIAAAPRAADPADAAILRAAGDDVSLGHIRNGCGAEVRPVVSHPAPQVAVVIEADPTGACSGSSLPSSLTVVLRGPGGWRVSTSTTGTGYEVRRDGGGMPSIIVEYPPSQVHCPVLGWTGAGYAMTRPCGTPAP